jgi:hypothetical protein
MQAAKYYGAQRLANRGRAGGHQFIAQATQRLEYVTLISQLPELTARNLVRLCIAQDPFGFSDYGGWRHVGNQLCVGHGYSN